MSSQEKYQYKNLVFGGASSKIYCYLGAIDILERNQILDEIIHYLGTSSGSIIATMLALGYSSKEIKELIYQVNPSEMNIMPILPKGIYNLFKTYGYLNTKPYIKWIKNMIRVKSNNEDLTFKQLYDLTNKILTITGTCINKRETHYYNYISNPNMPIFKAIQISTSLPLAFPMIKWGSDELVDGGLLENYPFYYIKECGSFPNSREEVVQYKLEKDIPNKHTIGIKIFPENYEKSKRFFIGDDKTESIKDYLLNIVNTLLTQIERNTFTDHSLKNTISIKIDKNIDSYNFNLSTSEKDYLYEKGQKYTNEFLTE